MSQMLVALPTMLLNTPPLSITEFLIYQGMQGLVSSLLHSKAITCPIPRITMKNFEFPLLLAVATKDGLSINEHFGHVKQFRIYQLSPDKCRFLEIREVANYCMGQHADESAMPGILAAVIDCHAVFVAKIGDGPTDKLKAIGVGAVSDYAYAAIEASLLDYAQQLSAGQED